MPSSSFPFPPLPPLCWQTGLVSQVCCGSRTISACALHAASLFVALCLAYVSVTPASPSPVLNVRWWLLGVVASWLPPLRPLALPECFCSRARNGCVCRSQRQHAQLCGPSTPLAAGGCVYVCWGRGRSWTVACAAHQLSLASMLAPLLLSCPSCRVRGIVFFLCFLLSSLNDGPFSHDVV